MLGLEDLKEAINKRLDYNKLKTEQEIRDIVKEVLENFLKENIYCILLYNEIEELIKKSLDELQGGLKEKLEKLHNFSRLKDLEVELLYELNSLLITKPISDYIKEKIIKI